MTEQHWTEFTNVELELNTTKRSFSPENMRGLCSSTGPKLCNSNISHDMVGIPSYDY